MPQGGGDARKLPPTGLTGGTDGRPIGQLTVHTTGESYGQAVEDRAPHRDYRLDAIPPELGRKPNREEATRTVARVEKQEAWRTRKIEQKRQEGALGGKTPVAVELESGGPPGFRPGEAVADIVEDVRALPL